MSLMVDAGAWSQMERRLEITEALVRRCAIELSYVASVENCGKRKIHRAERELEDVKCVIGGRWA